jgi:hypothetical protein
MAGLLASDGGERARQGRRKTMHPYLAQDVVRQYIAEINRKAEEAGRRRPPRKHSDERVLRWFRRSGE